MKFTETFGSVKGGPAFKPKSGVFALALQRGQLTFRHLDAAQLLKHALGLQANHPGSFTLVYLYADEVAPEARQHRHEVTEFEAARSRFSIRGSLLQGFFEETTQFRGFGSSLRF